MLEDNAIVNATHWRPIDLAYDRRRFPQLAMTELPSGVCFTTAEEVIRHIVLEDPEMRRYLLEDGSPLLPGPGGQVSRPQQSAFYPLADCIRTAEGMYICGDGVQLPPRSSSGDLLPAHYQYLDASCKKDINIDIYATFVQDDWYGMNEHASTRLRLALHAALS